MKPFIGFVLVTHSQPEQIAHLCWKLSSMFSNPPIAIHHDYGKCCLDPSTLPPQVQIVEDWVATAWGDLSLVDAYLAALRLLHSHCGPEWTVNLSAADYPIKSADYILNDLRSSSADVFLDYRRISKHGKEPSGALSCATTYKQPEFMAKAHERYLSFSIVHYHIRKLFGRAGRSVYVSADWLTTLLTPFSDHFPLYAGDWWHTVNTRAVAVLIANDSLARRLRRFYLHRPIPDESYCHTLLVNRADLRVENDNHRYTIWTRGAYHPKLLEASDIPALVASNAWFARKFPFDIGLYHAVDAAVAGS